MAIVTTNNQYYTAIANAIRGKNGTETTYKPGEMAAAIANLPSGGGDLPEEALVITGDCSYRFANNGWNWFIKNYGDRITTEDITGASYMFSVTSLTEIPFEINMKQNKALFSNLFANSAFRTIPRINVNLTDFSYLDVDFSNMFSYCTMVNNLDNVFNASALDTLKTFKVVSSYSCPSYGQVFDSCYSLRSVPQWWYKLGYSEESTTYPGYSKIPCYYAFQNCYVLDEIKDIPINTYPKSTGSYTSNIFRSMLANCYRLKSLTFALNDGVPYVVRWKSQTLDLSQTVGYAPSSLLITDYNSGISESKQVRNDEDYQALKNDPDWFTTKIEYSRYNHDSAVETINSLPDTSAYLASAGGTNTIKFDGDAGSATDGGAINTLTPEEIAIATAKGWTVTFA